MCICKYIYIHHQSNQKSPISETPMKHPRPSNLKTTHRHLRDLTYVHIKSIQRPHVLGHTLQIDQSPHVLRHTPTKTSESTILGGHTLSNRSETSRLGSHTHTHRSKTLAIRHTLTNTMELTSSDGQIEVSRPRTLYPFLNDVLTNHHNLSVMKKHTFIYYIKFL